MAKTDAPNYRDAGPATTQVCATCRYATANSARDNWCSLYQFQFDRDAVCDSWRPNVAAVRDARQELAQEAEAKTVKEARSIIGRAGQGVLGGVLTMTGVNVMLKAMREYMAHGNGGLLSPAGLRRAIANAMLGPWDEEDEEGTETKPGDKRPGPSIKNPKLYEALLARGYSKAQAAAIANSTKAGQVARHIITSSSGTKEGPASKGGAHGGGFFTVFKDSAGQQRWLAVSSSAYKDKDEEIVSRRALHLAVAIADATKERGPLRWWHMPGVDVGDCDFQMVHGRMLVESGTFHSATIARKVARAAGKLHLSIGFHHPLTEPQAGVYDNIVIFERSLVPAGLASNRFTSLQVKEFDMASTQEKLDALRALLGAEADTVLAGVGAVDKAAADAGVVYKEAALNLAGMSGTELLDYALGLIEKEVKAEAQPAPEPAETPQPAGGGGAPTDTGTPAPVAKEAQPAAAIHGVTINADALTATEFRDTMKAFADAVGVSLKEVAARVDQPDPAVAQVQQQIADLTAKLKEAQEALAALTDEQPRALKNGYRASVQGTPVDDPQAKAQAQAATQKENRNGNHWGEFEDIAARLNPWMPGAQQQ